MPEWWPSAACRGSDPGLFHGTPATHRQAQLLCRRCPVAEICLWSAMVAEALTPYRYGVWGAHTGPQRHELDAALGHPAVGEYLARLYAALEGWTTAQSAGAAQGATDAALAPPFATVRCQASAAPPATGPTTQRSATQPKHRAERAALRHPQRPQRPQAAS